MPNIINDIRNNQIRHGKSKTHDGVLYVGVAVGLFHHEHMERMGLAIYVFGCLLAKVTGWSPRYMLGAVLKGAPIKLSILADQTGIPERTVRRHIKNLEHSGYLITVRKQRGLSFYITNYKPVGKPNLGAGECPPAAILKLSELAEQGLVRGQLVAACDGINEHFINTQDRGLKHEEALYLQPNAEIYFLLLRLFNVSCGTAELRYFFTGAKKKKQFVDLNDFLKAVGRTLLAHEHKQAEQERRCQKVTGITNIVAYLNGGLHGRVRYLLRGRRGEESYIERVHSIYYAIRDEVADYKNKRNIEKIKEVVKS